MVGAAGSTELSLGFRLSGEDGELVLSQPVPLSLAIVDSLCIKLGALPRPVDLSLGVTQFQRMRGELVALDVSFPFAHLQDFWQSRIDDLSAHGFGRCAYDWWEDTLVVAAELPDGAWFSCRLSLSAHQEVLWVHAEWPRIVGVTTAGSPVALANKLLAALTAPWGSARPDMGLVFEIPLVKAMLTTTLPWHGWRIPRRDNLTAGVQFGDSALTIGFRQGGSDSPTAISCAAKGDRHWMDGDLAAAAQSYEQELDQTSDSTARILLLERWLQLDAEMRSDEGRAIARLQAWPRNELSGWCHLVLVNLGLAQAEHLSLVSLEAPHTLPLEQACIHLAASHWNTPQTLLHLSRAYQLGLGLPEVKASLCTKLRDNNQWAELADFLEQDLPFTLGDSEELVTAWSELADAQKKAKLGHKAAASWRTAAGYAKDQTHSELFNSYAMICEREEALPVVSPNTALAETTVPVIQFDQTSSVSPSLGLTSPTVVIPPSVGQMLREKAAEASTEKKSFTVPLTLDTPTAVDELALHASAQQTIVLSESVPPAADPASTTFAATVSDSVEPSPVVDPGWVLTEQEWIARATEALNQKQFGQAKEAARKARDEALQQGHSEYAARATALWGDAAWETRDWSAVETAYTYLRDTDICPVAPTVCAYRLAIALDQRGQIDNVAEMLEDVINHQDTPSELVAASWPRLAALYQHRGELLKAAEAYEALATDPRAKQKEIVRADAWYRAGELYRQHDSTGRHPARCYEQALTLAPRHLSALDALERLWREQNNFEGVISALKRKLDLFATTPGKRKSLLARLVQTYFEPMQQFAEAWEAAQDLLELEEPGRDNLLLCAKIAEKAGHIESSIEIYKQLSNKLPGEAQMPTTQTEEARREIARLRKNQNALPGFGTSNLAEVRASAAQDAVPTTHYEIDDATRQKIESAMMDAESAELAGDYERALAQWELARDLHPGELRPLRELVRLYPLFENYEAYGEMLLVLAERTADNAEKAQLWRRRGKLFRDVFHRETEAYRSFQMAYVAMPNDPEIAHEFKAFVIARSQWPLAAELTLCEITAAQSAFETAALHCELAMILEEKLGHFDKALHHYEQALRLDGNIPAVPKPLAKLYQNAGRFLEAGKTFELAARYCESSVERGRMFRQAASCFEAAEHPDLAKRVLEQAQHSDSATPAPSQPLHESHDLPPAEKITFLENRLLHAKDGDEAADLRRQILDVALRNDDKVTVQKYASALVESNSAEFRAYLSLKSEAVSRGNWPALVSLLGARISAATAPRERASLYFELGRLHERELTDPDAACEAYENSLREDPNHPGALEALSELCYLRNDWGRARELYERINPETSGLPPDFISYRRGEIAEILGDDAQACVAFARAVELYPYSRQALAGLSRTALRIGDLERALGAARSALALTPVDDAKGLRVARLQLADMCQKTGALEEAIQHYQLVRADDPKSTVALGALVELYKQIGNIDAAANALSALVKLTALPSLRTDLLYRLGILCEKKSAWDDAIDNYLCAIDLDPSHTATLQRLMYCYCIAGDEQSAKDTAAELAQLSLLTGPGSDPEALAAVLLLCPTLARSTQTQIINWLGQGTPQWLGQYAMILANPPATISISTLATNVALLVSRHPIDNSRSEQFLQSFPDSHAATAVLAALQRGS